MQKFIAFASMEFVNKYLYIWIFEILYMALLHKSKFSQAHCVELLNRLHTKFTLKFLDLSTSFSRISKFEINFLELFKQKRNWKRVKWSMG
jgi:hypothetical protein